MHTYTYTYMEVCMTEQCACDPVINKVYTYLSIELGVKMSQGGSVHVSVCS